MSLPHRNRSSSTWRPRVFLYVRRPAATAEAGTSEIEALFARYAPEVAGIGLAMLGGHDEAQDLVQDVFLRAWRGIGQLRSQEAVKPWLMTIAVRAARTRLRRRAFSRVSFGIEEPMLEEVAAPGPSPEDRLLVQRLFTVLNTMPANLSTAWVLRFIEAEKVERVASLCGWSLSTTKRRIKAAQQSVQEGMGAAGVGGPPDDREASAAR